MRKMMFNAVTGSAVATSLVAGHAAADSFYTNQIDFLNAVGGTPSFESFESASGSGFSTKDFGDLTISDTDLSINSVPGLAMDGSNYLYNRGGGGLTFDFDVAVDSVGFYLSDLFWADTNTEIVITTDTGVVWNTGVDSSDGVGLTRYFGLIADTAFSSVQVSLQAGDGVRLDSVHYYGNIAPVVGPQNDSVANGASSAYTIPTPTASIAGLSLLGLLTVRRRRQH